MAKEKFRTDIGGTNYQPYIQKPVVDKSGGIETASDFELGTGVANMAFKGYDLYDKQKTLQETEQGVYKLMEQYNETSPSAIKNLQDENNRLNSQIEGAVTDTYAGIDTDVDVKALQSQLTSNTRKIELALQQESISPSEFYSRYSKEVRNLVRQNPSRAPEIMKHAETMLDLYGFKRQIKEDADLLKSQQTSMDANVKFMRQYLKDMGLPQSYLYDSDGQITSQSLNNAMMLADKEQSDLYTFKQMEQGAKMNDIFNAQDEESILKNGLVAKASQGHIIDTRLGLYNIFSGVDEKYANMTDDQKIYEAQNFILLSTNKLRDSFSPFMGNDVIKGQVEGQIKLMEALKDNIQAFSTGTYLKEQLEQDLTIIQKMQEKNLHLNTDVPRLKFLMSIFGREGMGLQFGDLLSMEVDPNDPEGRTKSEILFDFVLDNLKDVNSQAYDLTKSAPYVNSNLQINGKSVVDEITNVAGKQASTDTATSKEYEQFDYSLTKKLATINAEADQSKRFKQHETLIKTLGDKNLKKGYSGISAGTRGELMDAVEVYTKTVYNQFQDYIAQNPDMKWSVQVDAYGQFFVKGGDATMKRTYMDRFNAGINAYANVTGKESADVAEQFVKEYAPYLTDSSMWRQDNTMKSDEGFQGQITNKVTGEPMTELTANFEDVNNGQDIPLITSYSTEEDLNYLRNTDPRSEDFYKNMPDGLVDRAVKHANDRLANNDSVFFNGPMNESIMIPENEYGVAVDRLEPIIAFMESSNTHIGSDGELITSDRGAKGKYQIMPETGKNPGYGIEPLKNDSVEEHERFFRDYMKVALKEFDGDLAKAVASYHDGIPAIKKLVEMDPNNWYGMLGPNAKQYVDRFKENYGKY